jgi:hypothetical protein
MDMVLCNFDKHILKLDPSIETMDTNAPKLKSKKIVNAIIKNPRLFKDLEPIDGSIDAVHRLFRHLMFCFYLLQCGN